ncbi:MAG: hypothetical protein ACM3UZ_15645 [Acidobacteriota bacterium]
MEKIISSKLGLYEVMGYIIPGLLSLAAINIAAMKLLGHSFEFKTTNEFITTAVLLVIVMFLGILLHEIGQLFEEYFFKPMWKGFLSQRFLLEEDDYYSQDMKEKLRNMAEVKYSIKPKKYDKKMSQEVFNLMYSNVESNSKDSAAQLFNAQYGMYRSCFAGSILMLFTYLVLLIGSLVRKDWNSCPELLFVSLFWLLVVFLFGRRIRRFGERFADRVIRTFVDCNS